MTGVTQVLASIQRGDPHAAEQLLPLVYEELRKLAAGRMAQEAPGQTLQATALVHEAYVRLVDRDVPQQWDSRGHFFAAAAEAMRRILVDRARQRQSLKRGGDAQRHDIDPLQLPSPDESTDILAVDEALQRLMARDPDAGRLVELRYFAGLTSEEAAEILGVSARTADRIWAYARSFLLKELALRD